MKTLFFTLLSIVWINTYIFCQENKKNVSELDNYRSLKENNKIFDNLLKTYINNNDLFDIWYLDSIVTYNHTGVDSFAIAKISFSYNAETHENEAISAERNTSTQDWKFIARNISTYNTNNDQILNIRYVWENENWIKYSKYVTEYNENEEDISETNFYWDTISNDWIKDFMVEFEYNEQGLQSQIVLSHKNYESQEWESFYKEERKYNEENLLVQQIQYNWDNQSLLWVNSEKLNSFYDDGLRSNDYYFWKINKWEIYKKNMEYRIDADTIGYNAYSFKDDSVWINDSKGQFTLNEKGIPTSQESYRYSYETNSWFGDIKFESFSSTNQQPSTYIKYRWDYSKKEWFFYEKTEYKNNENSFTFYTLTSRYNENLGEWYHYRSRLNYFSKISSINESPANSKPKLFPNPVINKLTLECEGKDSSRFEYAIYSLQGKLLEHSKMTKSNIDVSMLNPGLYILKIRSKTKIFTAKFTKL
ncbi:MAG: T9SS type A sorting domain-containing protein [Chlorobi bacterium]|nr:T9SS type A sorting domain-containing protein [Chlorobiota bacterium]